MRFFALGFLIIFYLIVIVRIIQLRSRGINVVSFGVKGKSRRQAAFEILSFVWLIIWSAGIVIHSFNLPILPLFLDKELFSLLPLKVAGIVLIFFGLVLQVWALISFGNSWRIGIDTEKGRLVTSGIFSKTRNPIFLAIDTYFLGTWFIFGNIFFLIFFVGAAVGTHWQILQEEVYLRKTYGKEYEQYIKQVPRYFLSLI